MNKLLKCLSIIQIPWMLSLHAKCGQDDHIFIYCWSTSHMFISMACATTSLSVNNIM
jgi:hypothetical protein